MSQGRFFPRKPSLQGQYLRNDGVWVRWRSTFELQMMIELDAVGTSWLYEPFKAIVGPGPKAVIPDFYLPDWGKVIDVKGVAYKENPEAVRKIELTREWCKKMGFDYEVRNNFKSLTAEELTVLKEAGRVKFTEESAKRIRKQASKGLSTGKKSNKSRRKRT